MIVLLDTNILIYLIKNHPPQVAERIDALDPNDRLAMSFVTWAALLQGAEGSQRRQASLRQLDQLVRQVPNRKSTRLNSSHSSVSRMPSSA